MNTEDIIPLRKQIGYILQVERERQCLTIPELSVVSETSRPQIISLEGGDSSYTVDTLLRVMAALGMQMVLLNQLMEGSSPIGFDNA